MTAVRALARASLLAALAFAIAPASGCGTDAKGIEDCRSIERARCAAGTHCGLIDDREACERFYRDHCLHGLAVSPPANALVDRCVNTIRAAGECAAAGGEDVLLSECSSPVSVNAPTLSRACDVVLRPEATEECAFLTPDPEPPGSGGSGGSGSSAGSGGSSGGSAGDDSEAGAGGRP